MRFSTDATRLEAFSDGVLAVIITIMVLDLRPPSGTDFASLHTLLPTVAAYAMSFVFIGIYWNNHHHMIRAAGGIDGRAMWANLHLLFWLSLVPFTTSWLGANPTAAVPTALYALLLLFDAIAYMILQHTLATVSGPNAPFTKAIASDFKGKISPVLYVCAIGFAFLSPIISDALIVLVAILWIVPDRRYERAIASREDEKASS